MERVQRNTSATISATFYVDGTATDPVPDTATVQIIRADGTVLVATTAATNAGVGKFSYTLTAANTALLDTLTATWTATLSGQSQQITSTIEVVGGYLFGLVEARLNPTLADTTAYPVDRLIAGRTQAERALEDACVVAFVPRYRRETLNGQGGHLALMPKVRTIRSVSIGGTVATDLTQFVPTPAGLYYSAGFAAGYGNVVVGYEHGYDLAPALISRAAIKLTEVFLAASGVNDRATRVEAGDERLFLAAHDPFGIPEVDAAVRAHRFLAFA